MTSVSMVKSLISSLLSRVPNLSKNAGAGAVLVHRKYNFAGAGAVLVRQKIIFSGAGAVRCTEISKIVVRTGAVRAGARNLIKNIESLYII